MTILKHLGEIFYHRFQKSSDQKAIGWIRKDSLKFYDYSEYRQIIEELAFALKELGAGIGENIAILAQSSKEWHLFDLAGQFTRSAIVPIYPTYGPEEIKYILNHSESSILIIDDESQFKKILAVKNDLTHLKVIISISHLEDELKKTLEFDVYEYEDIIRKGKNALESSSSSLSQITEQMNAEDIATIVYTSGTTGEPKGVVISQEALATLLHNVHSSMKTHVTRKDRNLVFLPLSHVAGRCDSLLHLVLDNEAIFAESIEKIIDNIQLARPTFMIAVPRIFEKIYDRIHKAIQSEGVIKEKVFDWANEVTNEYYSTIENDRSPTSSQLLLKSLAYKLVFKKVYERFGGRIRFFVSGGAPLSPDIGNFLRNANLSILEAYGLTETVGPCTLVPLSKQIMGTVGVPLGDVQIKFAQDNEIMIKSKALMKEYYKNPEATAEVLQEGWFKSGDIGVLTNDGYIKITDRKKDIIITSGGKNVAPQKIENIMKTMPYISQFMVVGDQRKFLTAIVGIEKQDFGNHLHELGVDKDCKLEELATHPRINEWIQHSIETGNQQLAKFETIKKFVISPIELSLENGFMTPSLKLKKKVLLKEFESQINAMYN